MYHTRYSYPFYIKDVRRVGQLRADKVVHPVGKVREVKTFPDGLLKCPKLDFFEKLSIIFVFFLRYTKAIKDKAREKRWKKDSSGRPIYMCQMFV